MNKYFLSLIILALMFGCSDPSENKVTTTQVVLKSVLNETFDVDDQSIWSKADWANGDPFYNAWCKEQVNINDGTLTLNLTKKECHSKTHASGEYRTQNTYLHGKYSVRFKASSVEGTISSFFTYTGPHEGTEWDEIDVEILGKDTTKMQVNYWRNSKEHPQLIDLGFDASLAMHTYSFTFSKDSLIWYVDGKEVHKVKENNLSNDDSLPINPGKIIVNLWAGVGIDSWSGHYTDDTNASASYEFITFDEFIE